jgi:hypothetical protein
MSPQCKLYTVCHSCKLCKQKSISMLIANKESESEYVCVCVCVEFENTGYGSDMCKVILFLITLPNSVHCCLF